MSLNLVPAIRELEREIRVQEGEFNSRMKPYRESLEQLRKLNTACETCGGTGKVLRSRACAEDDRPDPNDPADYKMCIVCKGTGNNTKGR